MTSRSKYRATLDTDCVRFMNVYNGDDMGYVEVGEKPFSVRFPTGELVGIADGLRDALPLLLDKWEAENLEYRQNKLAREKEAAHRSMIGARQPERNLPLTH